TYTDASLPLFSGRTTSSMMPSSISGCRPEGVFIGSVVAWEAVMMPQQRTPATAPGARGQARCSQHETSRFAYTGAPSPHEHVMTGPIRLDKRVADLAACSREDARRYIEGGWVTVDDVVV